MLGSSFMLQNELKAMLNEEECIGVPADEEYQST